MIFKERSNKTMRAQNGSIKQEHKVSRGNFLCLTATGTIDKIKQNEINDIIFSLTRKRLSFYSHLVRIKHRFAELVVILLL